MKDAKLSYTLTATCPHCQHECPAPGEASEAPVRVGRYACWNCGRVFRVAADREREAAEAVAPIAVVAHVDTRSFSFEAYGPTKAAAMEAMRLGWRAHRRQTGASLTWDELEGSITLREIRAGQLYRDGMAL